MATDPIQRLILRLARLLPDRVGYELVPRQVPASLDADAFGRALATLPHAAGEPWVAIDTEAHRLFADLAEQNPE